MAAGMGAETILGTRTRAVVARSGNGGLRLWKKKKSYERITLGVCGGRSIKDEMVLASLLHLSRLPLLKAAATIFQSLGGRD